MKLLDSPRYSTATETVWTCWKLDAFMETASICVVGLLLVFSLVKKKHFHAVRTFPVAAVNAQDDLLLKNDFLLFQHTVAAFYRRGGQICNLLVWNFLRISCTKWLKFVYFVFKWVTQKMIGWRFGTTVYFNCTQNVTKNINHWKHAEFIWTVLLAHSPSKLRFWERTFCWCNSYGNSK